jgi:undecaprenyl-diphosphatase
MYLFRLINGLAHKSSLLDRIMIIFSTYIPLFFMVALAYVYFYGVVKKDIRIRCIAVDTFVMTVINLIASFGIGKIYYVPRPFVHHKVNLLIPHSADASFPSDHVLGTLGIALGINNWFKIYGRVLVVLSLIVGVSRVYVGHHYPSDVLGGIVIAVIVNYAYRMLVKDKVAQIYVSIEGKFVKALYPKAI